MLDVGRWTFGRVPPGLRPVFPAQPEEEEGEKRNEPPVTVLLVDRPFVAQVPAKDEPERNQHQTHHGKVETIRAWFCRNRRVQNAPTLAGGGERRRQLLVIGYWRAGAVPSH